MTSSPHPILHNQIIIINLIKTSRSKAVKSTVSVAETATRYGSSSGRALLRDAVHVTVTRGEHGYVAECLEIAVVTQGSTLDELIFNLREAVDLHLEGEDLKTLGLAQHPRLVIVCDLPLHHVSQAQAAFSARSLASLGKLRL